MIRAALSFANQGLGEAILVGREDRVYETAAFAGIELEGREHIHIMNAALSKKNTSYAQFLYDRLQRKGFLFPRLPNACINPGPATTSPPNGGDGEATRMDKGGDAQLSPARNG